MTIQDHLDSLRDRTPGCVLAAYGDISSGLILSSSADKKQRREVLDTLCYGAMDCFDLMDEVPTPKLCDKEIFGLSAVSFTTDETQVFARTFDSQDDVICAVMNPAHPLGTALQQVTKTAQDALEDAT